MKHFIFFLLLLLGACEPALESNQFGDNDMTRRVNENKPVAAVPTLTPVAVVTPSHGWWSGSNNVGNEVSFAPDSNNRQSVLTLPEIGAPEMWTVSLYIVYPTPSGSNLANFRVKARIEFGAGGSTQIVEMDWITGAQISVPANAINVIAEYSTVNGGVPGIRLGVQVARGRRGGTQPPRLTMSDMTFLGPLEVANFPIPEFVSRIHILPAAVLSVPLVYSSNTRIGILSSPTGGSFIPTVLTGDFLIPNDGVEVSGAGRILQVVNSDAVNSIQFAVFADLFG